MVLVNCLPLGLSYWFPTSLSTAWAVSLLNLLKEHFGQPTKGTEIILRCGPVSFGERRVSVAVVIKIALKQRSKTAIIITSSPPPPIELQ